MPVPRLPPGAASAHLPWPDATLWLLPQRAAYCPASATLLVADVHLGKAASFRRLGLPVPEATTDGTLARLDAAVQATDAACLVILGDLLHAPAARSGAPAAAFQRWRERHAGLEIVLVEGNHDARAGAVPPDWGVRVEAEPWCIGPWALAHHPEVLPRAGYRLAGHVHPAVRVGRGVRGGLRLPCFHFSSAGGLLPAFGEFTGSHVLVPSPGDRLWVLGEGSVHALPSPAPITEP